MTPQKRHFCFKEQGKFLKKKNVSKEFSQFFKPLCNCFEDRLETVFFYFASISAFLDSKVSDSK